MSREVLAAEFLAAELPAVLAAYAEVTSLQSALDLALKVGGRTVYIPMHPRPGTGLVDEIGMEATVTLLRLFGHGRLLIPLGATSGATRRRSEIEHLLAQGASVSEVVRRLKCHERTVYRHKRRGRGADRRQAGLL